MLLRTDTYTPILATRIELEEFSHTLLAAVSALGVGRFSTRPRVAFHTACAIAFQYLGSELPDGYASLAFQLKSDPLTDTYAAFDEMVALWQERGWASLSNTRQLEILISCEDSKKILVATGEKYTWRAAAEAMISYMNAHVHGCPASYRD